jgi:transposase
MYHVNLDPVLTLDQLGISEEDWNQTPASVRAALMFLIQQNQRLENRCATYELQVQKLEAELERLKKLELEVAELRERLGQNSQNSSKPPSSDPPSVSRPNKYQPTGRKRGGQRGQHGQSRNLLPLEEVDAVIELRPTSCGQCGQLLLGEDPHPVRHQVSEIPVAKTEVTEYRQHRLTCLSCGAVTEAEWPTEMPRGSFGPRAQATVGYLTGRLGLSHRDVVEAMEALHGLKIGLGSVSAIQQRVSNALEQPVKTAQQYVHQQGVNHIDETGWPEGEKQKWLWINATSEVTVFRLLNGRGQAEAKEVIGRGYLGTVSTDRYAAYHWVDAHRRQLCWAHLKREFQAIKERGEASAEIGEGLLKEVKEIFEVWYELRGGSLNREEFQSKMGPIEARVEELLRAGAGCGQKKTQRTCENILKQRISLWTFVREPNVEPTNNDAERPLRRAVLWRRKSFGTQSKNGSCFVERILTAVTTLRQQGRDVLEYLTAVCQAALGQPHACCLLPDSS